MRPRDEEAVYAGKPLSSLRGLSPEYFGGEHDEYLIEDATTFAPAPSIDVGSPDSDSHFQPLDGRYRLAYTSESPETLPSPDEEERLPIFAFKEQICETIRNNPVTIVVAETGAGKSTEIPQYLLENGWKNIFITQPRRIAARNVYERIKSELARKQGDDAQHLVSCQTAEKKDGHADAPIKVLTDGLYMVKELHGNGAGEQEVLIIDECHEWNTNMEVLVAVAKQKVIENPNLRVVISSATIDAYKLAEYFEDGPIKNVPVINVPGRHHNIERREVPDSHVVPVTIDSAEMLYNHNEPDSNGILVFLQGKREIKDTIDEVNRTVAALYKRLPAHLAKVATILPLHSKLSRKDQEATLQNYPGVKIVVSTNASQTSLTIPDIKVVVDSGLERRIELDHEGTQGLVSHAISKADCDQRAGRAGRVSDGFYFLTRQDELTPFIPYIEREDYPTPEILRTDIVRNTLRVAGFGLDMAELDTFHPVDLGFIEQAQHTLQTLGALDSNNKITRLGERMDAFPLGVLSSLMMVESSRFSEQTRAYMAAIVAAREVGGLQYFSYDVGKRWKELTDESSSDLLAQLDIFIATQNMSPFEMAQYDLDVQNIERAREIYQKVARLAGVKDAEFRTLIPASNAEREDLKYCIYSGSLTSMYQHLGGGNYAHIGAIDTVREISNRSVVTGRPEIIFGTAYRVVVTNKDGVTERHIVESVTAATLANIGKLATHLSDSKHDGYTLRDGKFVERRRQFFGDLDLKIVEEAPAEPSPQLRQTIIAHVLENPGRQQRKLREIKKALERLDRIAKTAVPKLTQEQLENLIDDATPQDVTDPTVVDNNLRLLMTERNISLDSFVDPDRQARIKRDAPRELVVNKVSLPLKYSRRKPIVSKFTPVMIARLDDEIYLADGRHVLFMYDRKIVSLLELKEKLGITQAYEQTV